MKLKRTLEGAAVLAIFLLPILTPSVKHGSSVVFWFLFALGLFLGWPGWKLLNRDEKRLLVGFVILFAVAALSFINTEDTRYGFRRIEKCLAFPLVIPAYLFLRRFRVEGGRPLLLGCFVAAIVACLQATYQSYWAGIERTHGAYHYVLFGHVTMYLAIILSVSLLTVCSRPWHYGMVVLGMACASIASALSQTRGSWLAVPICAAVLLCLCRESLGLRKVLVCAAVLILVCGTALWLSPFRVFDRLIGDTVVELRIYAADPRAATSGGERLNMWRDAITIWLEHPILGTGLGDFSVHSRHLIDEGLSNMTRTYAHAHSVYFHVLATTGLAGLVTFVAGALVLPFRFFLRQWQADDAPPRRFCIVAGLLTIVSFAAFGLTESWNCRLPMVNIFVLSLVALMAGSQCFTR